MASRKVKPAPKPGTISRALSKRAVKKVATLSMAELKAIADDWNLPDSERI